MEAAKALHTSFLTHYIPSQYYNITLAPQRGFHRTLTLTAPNTSSPNSSTETNQCILQALFFLPPQIFADPYELHQRQSDTLLPPFQTFGAVDLEAPASAVDPLGTTLLLDLTEGAQVDVPLHLRYPPPMTGEEWTRARGEASFVLPWPFVYYACPNEAGETSGISPFPDVPGPFTSPYPPSTSIHPLWPQSPPIIDVSGPIGQQVVVPAGNLDHLALVQLGTALAVLVAFLYVAYCAWKVPSPPPRPKHPTSKRKVE